MKKTIFATLALAALLSWAANLHALDLISDEGVRCVFTYHDMWKGKTGGEGMLFLGMFGENERIYIVWGKNRNDLVQKIGFSLRQAEKETEGATPAPPWYQEFADILRKAVEWEATADANGLEDVQKPIAMGWTCHKLKKGAAGRISKKWGGGGKNEIIEIRVGEIPKLLELFGKVPDMERKMQEVRLKLKEDLDRKKAEEKEKKDKVDSLLK